MLELIIAVSFLFGTSVWLYTRILRLENDVEVLEDYAELTTHKIEEIKKNVSKFDVSF